MASWDEGRTELRYTGKQVLPEHDGMADELDLCRGETSKPSRADFINI